MSDSSGPGLLLLAGYFPPVNLSTASVRTWNIAAGLRRRGWRVTVVTPHPSVWKEEFVENADKTSAQARELGLEMAYTGHRFRWLANDRLNTWDEGVGYLMGGTTRRMARLLGVDSWVGWIPELGNLAVRVDPDKIDAVLASGAPHQASFIGASLFSLRFQKPFFLDYRDLWTANPHLKKGTRLDRWLERKVLGECAGVTAISPSIAEWIETAGTPASKIRVITNGYDEREIESAPKESFDDFSIVYSGAISPPVRSIEPLMLVLAEFGRAVGPQAAWRFHYYGKQGELVMAAARAARLVGRVVCHGKVPRTEAIGATKGASIAAIITSVRDNGGMEDRGLVTGKVFEAIGARVPFLVIAPDQSDVEGIVARSGGGRCFPAADIQGMAAFVERAFVGHNVPTYAEPEAYSWDNLAAEFDLWLRASLNGACLSTTTRRRARGGNNQKRGRGVWARGRSLVADWGSGRRGGGAR